MYFFFSNWTDEREAAEFANSVHSAVEKRFLYTGKEQRREAKEQYEEKCERKLVSKAMNKPRWCPELTSWDAWQKAAINDQVKPKG